MRTNNIRDDAGDATVSLRSGMTVRVVNPNSPHYGSTGHLIGRNEQREPYWLVRLSTVAAPVHLLEEELVHIR